MFRRLIVEAYVSKITTGAIAVSWVLERDFNAPGPYTFTLRKHYTPTDDAPIDVASGVDVFVLEDRTAPVSKAEYDLASSYSIKLLDGDGNTYYSQVTTHDVSWSHVDWLLAREVVRKETLLQRKKAGTKGWLLKRKWYGDPCPCVNNVTGEVSDTNCETCFGTGIMGGYYPPYEYWVLTNPTNRVQKLTPDKGLITVNDETVRSLAYPVIEPNDVWVNNQTGDRFRVLEDVQAIARHRGIDIVLNARIILLPTSSVVYLIPLSI